MLHATTLAHLCVHRRTTFLSSCFDVVKVRRRHTKRPLRRIIQNLRFAHVTCKSTTNQSDLNVTVNLCLLSVCTNAPQTLLNAHTCRHTASLSYLACGLRLAPAYQAVTTTQSGPHGQQRL